MSDQRILITGAAGRVGRLLRPLLARRGRTLRLLDIAALDPAGRGEHVELVHASFTDPEAMRSACRGVDAIVHLGALSVEAPWERILRVNIDGTQRVLETARTERVRKVVLASSIHAAGFHTRDDAGGGCLPAHVLPRPDTYYGVSKAAGEALGSLYHFRFGIDVTCLRIGALKPRPVLPEDLAAWLSPRDAARLVEACLAAKPAAFRLLWGVSRNARRWWSLAEAEAIGYRPEDDAEAYATSILAGRSFDPTEPRNFRVGGAFCDLPLGEPPAGSRPAPPAASPAPRAADPS